MERCILNYILPILLTGGYISQDQYGSIPGRSPISQLVSIVHFICRNLDKGIPVDVMYFDFAKAFDNVDRDILFNRLRSTAIHPTVTRLIEALFSGRSHCVRVGTSISDSAEVDSGVVQGTVLGPVLFVLHLSLMPRPPSPINNYLFVDDTKWAATVNDFSDGYALQEGCDALHSWSVSHNLPLSPAKCTILHYGANNPIFQYRLDSKDLPAVPSQVDLGVLFDEKLCFSAHCERVANKAMSSIWMLRRCFKDCTVEARMFAFKTYVIPVLMYASPVWSPYTVQDITVIEQPQRSFTKFLPSLYEKTYCQRLALLGVHSLEWLRLQSDLLLWYRIFHDMVYLKSDVKLIQVVDSGRDTRSHPYTVKIPFALHSRYYNSFVCRSARVWNALPASVVLTENYNAFRRLIMNFDLSPHLKVFPF